MARALLVLWLLSVSFSAKAIISSDYDDYFKKASDFLPPYYDWRLLKAQCFQESGLNPFAVSPVGAKGLCQFMPLTWEDMQVRNVSLYNPFDAEQSIIAASIYMNDLLNAWSAERPTEDKIKLALASYNAGMGNLLKAQDLSEDKVHFYPISQELHQVTGHHHKETLGYVDAISNKWYPLLLLD